jgi:hypothetical protein
MNYSRVASDPQMFSKNAYKANDNGTLAPAKDRSVNLSGLGRVVGKSGSYDPSGCNFR